MTKSKLSRPKALHLSKPFKVGLFLAEILLPIALYFSINAGMAWLSVTLSVLILIGFVTIILFG